MRRTIVALLWIAGLVPGAAHPGGARLTYLSGQCQIAGPSVGWQTMHLGDRAKPGQQVRTLAKSLAELSFTDGTVVRLAANSLIQFRIDQPGGPGANRTVMKALAGQLWAHVTKGRGQFAVTGSQAVAAVTGTTFRMDVEPTRTATVVYEGSVGVQAAPEDAAIGLKWLDSAPRPSATPMPFGKPTVIDKPYRHVEPPFHLVPGPYPVSRDAWLTLIAKQRIDVAAGGHAVVSEVVPGQEADETWVRWNQERDAAAKR